jgi:hypothetical protein
LTTSDTRFFLYKKPTGIYHVYDERNGG